MDLPTCPACKQSVLDDDAAECPFCGAPMKGGVPARTAAAPAPAKPAPVKPAGAGPKSPPAVTRGTGGTSRPVAESATTEPADDDPFSLEKAQSAKAIPLSPRPAAGRTLELVCPMCETKGFAPPRAVGQLVKCANPQCMVPVFTAPAPKKEPAPPPPPPKKKSPVAMYVGVAVVSAVVLGGVAYYTSEPPGRPSDLTQLSGVPAGEPVTQPEPVGQKDKPNLGPEPDPNAVAQKEAGDLHAELSRQLLQKLTDGVFNAPQLRKPYCRRMAAIAHFESGNVKVGLDQLDLLKKSGGQTQYEGVLPLTVLAWRQSSESPKDFKKTVAELAGLAAKLPERGRYATEAAVATAAVLVVAGKLDDARGLLARHHSPPAIDLLAAALQVAASNRTYNLDVKSVGRSLGNWQAPLETAVTLNLIYRGHVAEARTWAEASTDSVVRAEGLLVWAEAVARRSIASQIAVDWDKARAIADTLEPSIKARLLARLADVQLTAGAPAPAQELLKQAIATLGDVPSPPVIRFTNAKSVLDLKLPDVLSLRQAAFAATEIAGIQARLGESGPAFDNIRTALKHLRGAAPGLTLIRQRLGQLDSDAETIRGELKSALQLKTEDQIRRTFNQYKQTCRDLVTTATARFQWQSEILEAAVEFGLLDQAWEEIRLLDGRPDLAERDPLFDSAVPKIIAARYASAGNLQQAKAVETAIADRLQSVDVSTAVRVIQLATEQLVAAGNIENCIQALNDAHSDAGELDEWALRLACRLVNDGKLSEALELTGNLRDIALHDDGLFLVAAFAARSARAADLWKLCATGLGVPETSAVSAGLITGLAALPEKNK